MKAFAEVLELLRPHLFVRGNRYILARAYKLMEFGIASGYFLEVKRRKDAEEARKLADKNTREMHPMLRGKALDRERRLAFKRALRRIEKRPAAQPVAA